MARFSNYCMDGWLIKLENPDKDGAILLEPRNLKSFKVPLIEGQLIEIVYMDTPSPIECMCGKVVKLYSVMVR